MKKDKTDILTSLLDPNNDDPIVLTTEDGEEVFFEQIAVIPHEVNDETVLFAILKPRDEMEGVADDEAIVFRIDVGTDGEAAFVVEEESIAVEVFSKYCELLEEESEEEPMQKEKKKPKK